MKYVNREGCSGRSFNASSPRQNPPAPKFDSASIYRVASVASTMSGGKDKTAPTSPTNLTASAVSCSQVNLSWGASSDTGSNATGVKGYNIYRNGVFLQQVLAPATSTSDAGLT